MAKRKPGKHALHFEDPHLTKQDHQGTADIGAIARKYLDGSEPYPDQVPQGKFADLTRISAQTALQTAADLLSLFAELPADVRDYLDHDPSNYIGYIEDNSERIAELGLSGALIDDLTPDEETPIGDEKPRQKQTQEALQASQETEPPNSQGGDEQHS